MGKELVFMPAGAQLFVPQDERPADDVLAARRVAVTDLRRIAVRQPMELRSPAAAAARKRVRPSIPGQPSGVPRDQVRAPISPVAEPADTLLFEDPLDASKKFYLPRYRLRETAGRYDFVIAATQDGGWRLSLGLERFPAPELGNAAGAQILAHRIAVFFRYGAGPAHTIEKRVDFTEPVEDAKGVTVSVRLTLGERDGLLQALKNPAAAPALTVRRAITVAVKVTDTGAQPVPPVLFTLAHLDASVLKAGSFAPVTEAPPVMRMATIRDHSTLTVASPAAASVSARRANILATGMLAQPHVFAHALPTATTTPTPAPAPAPTPVIPVDTYRVIERALDDVADPDPFVLDPVLHPYVYAGASGASTSTGDYRRIPLSHPPGAPDARIHAYFQDRDEPWVFYCLPDRFKLARPDTPPFLPQMGVHIDAPDGALENARVTIDSFIEPSFDPARLTAAAAALEREHRGDPARPVELRRLQAAAKIQLSIPGPAGALPRDMEGVAIDLENGFSHILSVPLPDFLQLYAAAYGRGAGGLFTGSVIVDTGLSKEIVPLAIRFADTTGGVLSFTGADNGAGAIAVELQNATESPVRISSLPVRVRRGDAEAAATIEGASFTPPVDLASGAKLALTVRPQSPLPGDAPLDALFDTSGVEILPDPEAILPLISGDSVPAEYKRQISVMTVPEFLGDPASPDSILLINVEFKGNVRVRLTRDHLEESVLVWVPLIDLLLGRDTQGRYAFRQQIVRKNGTQTVDSAWRTEAFPSLLVPQA